MKIDILSGFNQLRNRVTVMLATTAAAAALIPLAAGSAAGAELAQVPLGLPRYYVTVQNADGQVTAAVRDSADGHVTGTVTVGSEPASCGSSSAGAADDRHFVIDDTTNCGSPGVSGGILYLLTVSANGQPGRPVKLARPAVNVSGMALSPDGRMLALSELTDVPGLPDMPRGGIAIVNLVTGATTFDTLGAPGYWPGVPLWTDEDRLLSVPWWHSTTHFTAGASISGVRQFAVVQADSATVLTPDPVRQFPAPVPGLASALITSGGDLVGAACHSTGPDTAIAQVSELSAASGQNIRLLYTQTIRSDDVQATVRSRCSVLSVDPTGQHILIQAFTFGRIDDGAFTPLPGTGFATAAAW